MSPLQSLSAGATAGAIAQTVSYPFDIVRRRFQIQGIVAGGKKYGSMSSAFVAIVRDEGPMGLFKGMMPNYAKVIPAGT
jgi:solute carrier family 25 phosphate transporter 23/24/25/41